MTNRLASSAVFYALACTLSALILAQPAWASQDGPLHLYYARILHDLLRGGLRWGDYYVIRPGFPPYMLHNAILIAAQEFVAPLAAEKILVVLCVVLLCCGFRYALRALRPDAAWSTLFIFPIALHKGLYMGFYNFSLGLGIMLFVCGLWLRSEGSFARRHAVLFVVGMYLLAVTHPIPLVLSLCFVALETGILAATDWRAANDHALRAWLPAWIAQRRLRLTAAAITTPTLVYIALYTSRAPAVPNINLVASHIGAALEAIWPMRTPLQQVIRIAITAGAVALALAKNPRSAARLAVLTFSLACAVAYTVAPNNVNGADYFHERFALVGFLFLLLYGGALELRPRTAAALGLSAAALTIVLAGDQISRVRPFASEAACLDQMRPLRRDQRGLVLSPRGDIGPPGFNFSPCLHISAHYFRRARAVLVNSSWLHMPITAIAPRKPEPYHFLDPQFMTAYLLRNPPRLPRVDFIVAERCPPGAVDPELAAIVRRYSGAPPLRAGCIAVYDVTPELSARSTPNDRSAETSRP